MGLPLETTSLIDSLTRMVGPRATTARGVLDQHGNIGRVGWER